MLFTDSPKRIASLDALAWRIPCKGKKEVTTGWRASEMRNGRPLPLRQSTRVSGVGVTRS